MASKSRSLRNLKVVTENSYSEASILQVNNQNGSNASSQSQPVEQESCQPISDTGIEMIDNDGRRFRKRGRTTMSSIWNMEKGEKIFVEVDGFGVSCSREGATLGSFLGTIAVNGKYAPLDMPRWDSKDYKSFRDDILTLVQEKFLIPPETKSWVLESVGKKWRDYKSDLKLQYYSRDKPKEQVKTNVPKGVEITQWRILVNGWYTERSQKLSQINTANANKKKNKQTTGRKSYARLRKEMEIQSGVAPDRLTFFETTHRKKDGTYVDDNSKELMEKAKTLQAERSEGSSTNLAQINEEIFQELTGPEHHGRVRGMGSGITPTSILDRLGIILEKNGAILQTQVNRKRLKISRNKSKICPKPWRLYLHLSKGNFRNNNGCLQLRTVILQVSWQLLLSFQGHHTITKHCASFYKIDFEVH